MKKILNNLYNYCIEISKESPNQVSPYLLKKAHEKIIETNNQHMILTKKLEWFKKLSLKDKKRVASFLRETSNTIDDIARELEGISEFIFDIFLQLDGAPSISPDEDVGRGAQLLECKKIDGFVANLEHVSNGILLDYPSFYFSIVNDKNRKLETVKTFFLFNKLYTEKLFKNILQDQILIYDDLNKILVHLSLTTGTYSIIRIPKLPFLGLCHWWIDNEVILTDTKGKFYALDLKKKEIKNIPKTYKKDHYQLFYDFCKKVQTYEFITTVDSHSYTFTYLEKEERKAGMVNFASGKEEAVSYSIDDVFRVYYDGAQFFIIGDKAIEFKRASDKRHGIIRAQSPYVFTGAIITPPPLCNLLVASKTWPTLSPTGALSLYQLV